MNILTLKQAFDDTFDNARFCESILDTEPQLKNGKGVAMSLYIGAVSVSLFVQSLKI